MSVQVGRSAGRQTTFILAIMIIYKIQCDKMYGVWVKTLACCVQISLVLCIDGWCHSGTHLARLSIVSLIPLSIISLCKVSR